MDIIEAWDAKYGKPYLRDELDELSEKLIGHPETRVAGFVVDGTPNDKREIAARKAEVEEMHGIYVSILGFDELARMQSARVVLNGKDVAVQWITAFVECLCQMRRARAPIDEPADECVKELIRYATQ